MINQPCEECDAWVVLQSTRGLLECESTWCPPENLVLVTREPPDMMTWQKRYLQQFSLIVTCHENLQHLNILHSQHGQVWHLRNSTFDELLDVQPGSKPKLVSVICSNKTYTPGHRARIRLLKVLKQHFKELEVFGRGVSPIADKWDGIYPYKYHIVLENGSFPHYWTEKLTDAYLGYALPFYWGCPNLSDYFPSDAFLRIDPNNIDQSVAAIEQALSMNLYEKFFPAIAEARNLILQRYNLFPTLVDLCKQLPGGAKRRITLRPDFEYQSPLKVQALKVFSQIRQVIGG